MLFGYVSSEVRSKLELFVCTKSCMQAENKTGSKAN